MAPYFELVTYAIDGYPVGAGTITGRQAKQVRRIQQSLEEWLHRSSFRITPGGIIVVR